jgi:hypothetical protein
MCTNIGVTGTSAEPFGKSLIGSVSDDPYGIRTRVVVERPAQGYAVIGTDLAPLSEAVSMPDYSGTFAGWPTRALNEKGLAYTWTFAPEKPTNRAAAEAYKSSPAWSEIMRCCVNVAEAIDMLKRMPRDFSGVFMLADRSGDLAVVEAGRKSLSVTRRHSLSNGGAVVNVNCWLSQAQEGLPIAAIEHENVPNHARYHRALDILRTMQNRADFDGLAAMLRDHSGRERFAGDNPWIPGHGYSICNHGSLHGESFTVEHPPHGSVSGEIIDPVDGVFWYAYGWPCGESPDNGDQLLQERSWGTFVGFPLAALPAGTYTTLTGELTHLAAMNAGRLLHEKKAARAAALA